MGLLIFIIVILVLLICVAYIEKAKADAKRKKIIDEFGDPTLAIESVASEPSVYIFETKELIIIDDQKVPFEDILDFRLNDEKSYKTSTSTMGTIGRGIVGASLFGGVGAIVGGATAGKSTKTHTDKYTVYITVDDLAHPVIEYTSTNEKCAQQLMSVLKIIIDRKQSV